MQTTATSSSEQFLEDQLCTVDPDIPLSAIWEKVFELGDLKILEDQLCTVDPDIPLSAIWEKIFELGDTFIHVCKNQDEKISIYNLLAQVKGEPMVENATDGIESFMDSAEGSESFKSTSSSGVPDLADSYHSCQVI